MLMNQYSILLSQVPEEPYDKKGLLTTKKIPKDSQLKKTNIITFYCCNLYAVRWEAAILNQPFHVPTN